jgi:hypothetical protein
MKNENIVVKDYDINEYCNLTLGQIINLPDEIRLEMLKLYKSYIENNMNNRIRKNIITNNLLINNDDSLNNRVALCINELNKLLNNYLSNKLRYDNNLIDINNEIFEFESMNISTFISPGDIILFYPNIKEVKALNNITSDIQGPIIKAGSYYIEYKPFLENITKNICYVLKKSIKAEMGYRYNLPKNLHEFETWLMYLNNPDIVTSYETEIDFYDLFTNYRGSLRLKNLKKGRSYSKK